MPNSMFALLAFALFAFPPQQTTPPAATPAIKVIPLDAARMVNPVTPTPNPKKKQKAGTPWIALCAMVRTGTVKAILGSFPI